MVKRMVVMVAAFCTVAAAGAALTGQGPSAPVARGGLRQRGTIDGGVARAFGSHPLSFEPNVGQTDQQVRFLSRGPGSTLFLTPGGAVLSLMAGSSPSGDVPGARASSLAGRQHAEEVLEMKVLGADTGAPVRGVDPLPGTSNYFIGNDPASWRTSIPTFGGVVYDGVLPGVDLTFYGNGAGQLEYDFTVAAGVDPATIRLGFRGQRGLSLDGRDLVLHLSEGDLRQPPPVAYQMIRGTEVPVSVAYEIQDGSVTFVVGPHDPSVALVIDPAISYSSYLGGSGEDFGSAIKVDRFGNAYVFGVTTSTDFPVTSGAYQSGFAGGDADDFVTKLSRDGTTLLYSTYIGGSGDDEAFGLDVDHDGNAYLAGPTLSMDWPTTPGAFQETAPGGDHDGFVTKLNPSGSALVWSTYLGGEDHDAALSAVVDRAGDVFVTADTNSDDLPVSADAFQTQPSGGDCKIFDAFDPGDCEEDGGLDMFVAELNPSGSDVLYLTYLGGSGDEVALDLAVDRGGNAYVALETDSADFPVTPGAYQTTFAGGDGGGFDIAPTDNVIVKLNPTGSSLVYSTYLGGSGDECDVFFCYLSIDRQGHAFLASNTDSTDFPTTAGAPQTSLAGSFDLTMSELSTDGAALVYSTYLGGSDYDATFWNAVGHNGQAYVVGTTLSTDFPTVNAVQASFGGGSEDAVVAKLNKKGTAVLFSTYLGGSDADDGISMAVDPSGDVFLTGFTLSTDFPISAGAYQSSLDGFIDAFVTKIDLGDDEGSVSVIQGSGGSGKLGGRADTTVIGRPTP